MRCIYRGQFWSRLCFMSHSTLSKLVRIAGGRGQPTRCFLQCPTGDQRSLCQNDRWILHLVFSFCRFMGDISPCLLVKSRYFCYIQQSQSEEERELGKHTVWFELLLVNKIINSAVSFVLCVWMQREKWVAFSKWFWPCSIKIYLKLTVIRSDIMQGINSHR